MSGDDERRHRERLGVDPERELHHRHVAAHGDLVDLARAPPRPPRTPRRPARQRLVRARAQGAERALVHHRRRDPGDHVGAVGLLAVEHRARRGRLPGLEVEQRRHHGRRPEVEGDREAPGGRVAGLDVDQLLVADDRGDVECAARSVVPSVRRSSSDGLWLEVVDGVEHPLEVRALILERRLGRARGGASGPTGAGSRGAQLRRAPPWAGSAGAAPR